MIMEQIVTRLLQNFEEGKINRRQLVRSLALTASAASVMAPATAEAAEESTLKMSGLNHISYTVADYAKIRDFYTGLFGVKVLSDDGKSQCRLALGNAVLVPRNGSGPAPFVDHIAYSIDNWNKDRVVAELKGRGLDPQVESENSILVKDPAGFRVQLEPTPK
jgi:catechol 2,3-dioxygenase-like lactoylglutathione lyase family enzyme